MIILLAINVIFDDDVDYTEFEGTQFCDNLLLLMHRRQDAGAAKAAPALFMATRPKTMVYVDGFNLYYGAVKKTNYKWLNVHALCEQLLPSNEIVGIKYFTAMVSGREEPENPIRQNAYIRALLTTGKIKVFKGLFSYNNVWRPVVTPDLPEPRENLQLFSESAIKVRVVDAKEKSSDVNLASHLITDAWLDLYEVAVIVSNDSDLATAISLVKEHRKKAVGIVNPQRACHMASELKRLADFQLKIGLHNLAACQFTSPIILPNGKKIVKPKEW